MNSEEIKNKFIHIDQLYVVGVVFFTLLTLSELFFVISIHGYIPTSYFLYHSIFFLILVFNWLFMAKNLRNSILSKKYRVFYALLSSFFIFSIYVILFYPIPPYTANMSSTEIFIKYGPAFFVGITALVSISILVNRDVDARTETGKSMWSLRRQDSEVRKYDIQIGIDIISVIILPLFVMLFMAILIRGIELLLGIFIPLDIKLILLAGAVVFFIIWKIKMVLKKSRLAEKRYEELVATEKFKNF